MTVIEKDVLCDLDYVYIIDIPYIFKCLWSCVNYGMVWYTTPGLTSRDKVVKKSLRLSPFYTEYICFRSK